MVGSKILLLGSQKVAYLRCRLQMLRSCGLAVADLRLQTCGCGLQELRSCGLAVADKAFKCAIADLRLRIKKIEIRLRICGLRT